jgi:von Willebrand factor type C domain
MESTNPALSWRCGAARALALVIPLAASGCIDAVIGDIDVCKYDGKEYGINESFPARDGCNTCTCDKTGSVSCTEIGCIVDGGPALDSGVPAQDSGGPGSDSGRPSSDSGGPSFDSGGPSNGTCTHDGQVYKLGERFRHSDGCNTCSCTDFGVACTLLACTAPCKDGDKVYYEGESFPASDGCNTCSCGRNGAIACTEKACTNPCGDSIASDPMTGAPVRSSCGVCTYGGRIYSEGEGFPAVDGCNKCTCGADGSVGCTKIGCPGGKTCEYSGKVYQIGDAFPDELGCNSCSCTESGVACTLRYCDPRLACSFGNRSFASGSSVLCSDGCNSCLCNDGSWSSTDRACSALPKVERCTGVEGAAKARVLYLDGDALALEVGMGGCANTEPAFKLCFDGAFAESHPVQTRLRVVAEELTSCSAWTMQNKVFDLTPLREAFREAYQSSSGVIIVGLTGDSVEYKF